MPETQRILVVEDDEAMLTALTVGLGALGYSILGAPTGRRALELMDAYQADVTILDLGLPDLDGVEVCRRLRSTTDNPIVVVSADGDDDRKVAALDVGADDYVTKPFSMSELAARIRVAFRHRAILARVVDERVVRVGALVVDGEFYGAFVDGRDLGLQRREFELLQVLAQSAGRALTFDVLLRRAWDDEHVGNVGALRRRVLTLRRKLGAGPDVPRIESVAGHGYRLVLDEPDGAVPEGVKH
jgi:two-component system KDP operon response regulator KdpE